MCIAALLLSFPALGLDPSRSLTQYIHRIQQMQQGLPQATIFSILQSHDGYLWLGTQRGLVRFDGVRFTPFSGGDGVSLENSWVRSLLEDGQGNIWIGTNDSGLVKLREGAMTQYSTAQGFPSTSVHCLVPGPNGEIWACTPNGLVRIAGGKFTAFGQAQGLSTGNIRGACTAADGKLWAGGDSSELNVWDGERFVRHPLSSVPKQATVRSILCSSNGIIWVGTTNGLVRLKDGVQRRYTEADGIADDWIDALAEGSHSGLWIGTKNGFSRFVNGEIESFRAKDGLSQSTVYSLREDREGNLWVGTKHGLDQFFEGRTVPYTASEGLPSNDTGPVFQDRAGNIWVGTLGAGLARSNGRHFAVLTEKDGLASNTIYALAEDATGGLWVGTSAGLNRLQDGAVEKTYTMRDGLPGNAIRCLFRDSQGELWVGTSKGAAVFQNGRFVSAPQSRNPSKGPILTFGEDGDRRLYAATEGGSLDVYKGGTAPEVPPNALPARDVDALYKDQEGLLWMGTLGGGLRLLKDGKVFDFWMQDGLFDNEIYGIAGDGRGNLWMACSNGIFSVNRANLLQFAAGKVRKIVSTPYVPTDALRTIECKADVQPAVWRMRDGALWFSTIKGVIVLDPSHLDRRLTAPPVVIEDITVNGQRQEAHNIERMAPGQKNVEFRYTGLSYYVPSKITFRYKLDGFDKNWTDAGPRRDAHYTNLPPGQYVFRVTACNVDGTCDQTGSSVAFALAPEYYQRAWFVPLCAGLIGLGIWLADRLRIRRLSAQFSMILGERSRIARELHDTLIQGFSGVTMEMQALCGKLSSKEDRGTLQEIVQDAAKSLGEARRSVAGLRGDAGPQSGLNNAIAEAARGITEAKDIRLRLKLEQKPPELPAEVEYNLLRIAQEAVSNCVKHSGARSVEVSLQSTSSQVSLAVRDDGDGFGWMPGGRPSSGHYGLIGMQERAKQIGAGFKIDTEPGRGTTVRVTLPVRKSGAGAPMPMVQPSSELGS
jgi:ligand-binding sensor domain-containing protein